VVELQRVYDVLNVERVSTPSTEQTNSVNTISVDTSQEALVEALRRENELLRNQLDQANIEKLGLLDVLKSQTLLLQAPRDTQAEGTPRRRRWWHR